MQKLERLKILVAGGSKTGKTTLINKFIDPYYSLNQSKTKLNVTPEFSSKEFKFPDSEKVVILQFWDLCGVEIYTSTAMILYRDISILIITFDLQEDFQDSMKTIKLWIKDAKDKVVMRNQSKRDFDIPIQIIGTKKDLLSEEQLDAIEKQLQDEIEMINKGILSKKEGVPMTVVGYQFITIKVEINEVFHPSIYYHRDHGIPCPSIPDDIITHHHLITPRKRKKKICCN